MKLSLYRRVKIEDDSPTDRGVLESFLVMSWRMASIIFLVLILALVKALIPSYGLLKHPAHSKLFTTGNGGNAIASLKLSSREISHQLKQLLAENKIPEVWRLVSQERLNTFNVVTLMYDIARINKRRLRAGEERITVDSSQVDALAASLRRCGKRSVKGVDIGMGLYGLQIIICGGGEGEAVGRLVDALASKIGLCKDALSAKEIGMSLYGLKDFTSSSKEMKGLLRALTAKIRGSPTLLDGQAIGNCLYGLQNMCDAEGESVVRQLRAVLVERISASQTARLSAQHVGNALLGCKNIDRAAELLQALNPLVESCTEPLNPQEMSNALYGLKSMSSSDKNVRQLLSILSLKLETYSGHFKAQDISNAFFGLQRMNSADAEVRAMVKLLGRKLEATTDVLGSVAISNIFYGLRGLSSMHQEVRDLFPSLLSKLHQCSEPLDEMALANVLYGMHRIGSHEAGVRALLLVIADKYRQSSALFDAQACANALYGLQSMSSEHDEVICLLPELCAKISQCTEPFKAQEAGSALLGLKGLSSSHPEVRELLRAVAAKVATCKRFDGQALGNGFYGLQSLSSDAPEVIALLEVLHDRLNSCEGSLTLQHIGNSLYGLHNFRGDIRVVTASVTQLLALAEHKMAGGLEDCDREHLLTLLQSMLLVDMTMVALPSSLREHLHTCWDIILTHFAANPHPLSSGSKSPAELVFLEKTRAVLKNCTHVTVDSNHYLHGFEADLLLRNTLTNRILNIEVDGPSHLFPYSIRFCKLRDQFLKCQGVEVYRVSFSRIFGDEDIIDSSFLSTLKSFCAPAV